MVGSQNKAGNLNWSDCCFYFPMTLVLFWGLKRPHKPSEQEERWVVEVVIFEKKERCNQRVLYDFYLKTYISPGWVKIASKLNQVSFSWVGVSMWTFCTFLKSSGKFSGSWNHDSFEEDSHFKAPSCLCNFSMKYKCKQYLNNVHMLFKFVLAVNVVLVFWSSWWVCLALQEPDK